MRKVLLVVAGCLVALAVLFALGPRPAVDLPTDLPSLPDDVVAYLARQEAHVPGLRAGTEKTIVWTDASAKAPTPVSVVYLHGFSATRQETRPLSDTVAARLGANLFYTRLTGHGGDGEALGAVSVGDWLRDGYEAVAVGRRLGEQVVLVGTSTGGTLALWLAAQPAVQPHLLALVLISPNLVPKDPKASLLLWPWGETIGRLAAGPYRTWEPASEAQARYWNTRYPTRALVTMMGLVDLVERLDFSTIRTPTLILYAPQDQVVDPSRTEARFPELGASPKRLVVVEGATDPSHHVLAGDILSPATTRPVADTILQFLGPLLPRRAPSR